MLVADNNPIDRHYVKNPEELFSEPTSALAVDLANQVVLEAHLQCAGDEMPLSEEDEVYFGPYMRQICETRLLKDDEGW